MRAFVIAMEKEADQVRPYLGAGDRLYVSGVGKVNAAAATQKASDEGAEEVLNCGVAGGLDPAMEIGDVYEISQAVEYDFDLTILNGTRLGTRCSIACALLNKVEVAVARAVELKLRDLGTYP